MKTRLKHETLAAIACLTLMSAACGGGPRPDEAPEPPPLIDPVDPATAGTIAGTIAFDGVPPPPEPISMRSDPYCARENPDATRRTIVTGPDGGLQDVFVYVKDGLEALRFPAPAMPVVLDQERCTYQPRVLGMQVGQPLEMRNSDDTLHNVHAVAAVNQEFNRGSRVGDRHTHVFSTREVMVPFKCDVHQWMQAWVGVLDHPFHATTGQDGTFRLDGLPPGTYTIEVWHERLGTQTRTVTLAESDSQDVSFTFTM